MHASNQKKALAFVDGFVLPVLEKEPDFGRQIFDYDFLLEFSDRRSADPASLIQQALAKGVKKIRLFAYIPQCGYHCAYCPFPVLNDGLQEEDARRLTQEAMTFLRKMAGTLPDVESFSVGGGTPTTLSARGIAQLVMSIRRAYNIPTGTYVNMECSPDSLTEEKVAAAFDAGVTRFSMGVQTFDDEVLKTCKRNHTGVAAEAASKILLGQNFKDLNIDLMRGLPGQTLEKFADDIRRFIDTGIPSLHLYRLRLPPGHSLLKSEPYTKDYVRNVVAMQLIADEMLRSAGYQRHHSAHWTNNQNVNTVTSKPWEFDKAEIGFGLRAYSYFPPGEARNIKSVHKWRAAVENGESTFEEGSLYSPEEQEIRWIKFCLKSLCLNLDEYERCFGKTIYTSQIWPKIQRLIDLGVLEVVHGQNLSFTPVGYAIAEEAIRFLI